MTRDLAHTTNDATHQANDSVPAHPLTPEQQKAKALTLALVGKFLTEAYAFPLDCQGVNMGKLQGTSQYETMLEFAVQGGGKIEVQIDNNPQGLFRVCMAADLDDRRKRVGRGTLLFGSKDESDKCSKIIEETSVCYVTGKLESFKPETLREFFTKAIELLEKQKSTALPSANGGAITAHGDAMGKRNLTHEGP